jgi:hypothetical protein
MPWNNGPNERLMDQVLTHLATSSPVKESDCAIPSLTDTLTHPGHFSVQLTKIRIVKRVTTQASEYTVGVFAARQCVVTYAILAYCGCLQPTTLCP